MEPTQGDGHPAGLGPLGEAAARYAGAGWCVFPQEGKVPLIRWGTLDAPPEREVVERWWRRWPDAAIGCSCGPSGLVVVDADGEEGLAALEALEAVHGPWPATMRQWTGGGGLHLVYAAPPGRVVRGGRSGALAAHIDVKAAGGAFTLPPSLHRSGRRYAWDWDGPAVTAPAPAWLLERLEALEAERQARNRPTGRRAAPRYDPNVGRGTPYGLQALAGIVANLEARAVPGRRRDEVNVAALHVGHLVAGGELEEDHARHALLEAADRVFSVGPAPEAGEVDDTVRHGLEDGKRSPRSAPRDSPARPAARRVPGPGARPRATPGVLRPGMRPGI